MNEEYFDEKAFLKSKETVSMMLETEEFLDIQRKSMIFTSWNSCMSDEKLGYCEGCMASIKQYSDRIKKQLNIESDKEK